MRDCGHPQRSAHERNHQESPRHGRGGYCYSPSMTRASNAFAVSGIGIVSTLSFVACGNNFDALFSGSSSSSSSSSGGTSSASSSSSSSSSSGGVIIDPTTACGTPAAASDCKSNTNIGNVEVTNTCDGCNCECPSFSCSKTPGACSTTCTNGSSCTATCKDEVTCAFESNAAAGNFTCSGLTACAMDCVDGASCALDCSAAQSCTVSCDAKSQCAITCGSSTACEVDCGSGKKTSCKNGVVVCNANCPT